MSNYADFFAKEKEKLGITSVSTPENKGNSQYTDFFQKEQMDLGIIPDTRPTLGPPDLSGITPPPDDPTPQRSSGSSSWASPVVDETTVEQQSAIPAAQAQREIAGEWFEDSTVGRGVRDYVFEPFADAVDNLPKLFGLPVKETREASDAFGKTAGTFYTPGGTVKNIAGATRALGSAATKFMPNLSAKLSSSLGGRVAQGALREGTIGAPLTSANYLAQGNTQLDEAAEEGLYGAAFGGALGAAGPVVGKGLKALGQRAPESKVGQLINSFDPPPNPNELPYKPYEDVNLLSRFDTKRVPQQGARLEGTQGIVDSINRRDAPAIAEPRLAPVEQPVPRRELQSPEMPPANVDYDLLNQAMPKQPPVQPSRVAPAAIPDAPLGTRANYKNQVDNGNFSDELQTGIRNQDQSYEQISNREALATSNKKIADDITAAEAEFKTNETGGADHVTTGYRLMQELDQSAARQTDPKQKETFLLRAIDVANKLAADLTKAGQTVQAAKVLSRLSPEGQLLNLVRTAERNGKKVTAADSVKFKELAAKVQERSGAGKEANEFHEILNRMEKGENVGADDLKKLSNYISGAKKVVKPKPEVVYELPKEFKDPKKRDKVIAYFDDVEQAALARIASRKTRMNSLVLPDLREFRDHTIVVASQTAKGAINAATHVEDMVKLFGEEIRPVATQVFQGAQKLITGVSRGAAEGNLERAGEALRRMSGEAEAEKAIVKETANHVRKLIADAKAGKLDPADVQKLRDYSDEIVDSIKDKKPGKLPTQEDRFLQSVKSLAKKIAQIESEKIPTAQANREVTSLLRQITKLADESTPPLQRQPIDNKALSDIAHDVMEKTRPNPKPTTLQEKVVEKYIKQNQNVSPEDIEALRKLAKDVNRLSGDQKFDADIAMQKILNSYEKSSIGARAQTLRYMAMLWNTSTQAINAGSGPAMASLGSIADVMGTMLDISLSTVLKTPRSTTMYGTNPLRFIADYFKALPKGSRAGFHGVNPAGIQSVGEVRGLSFKSPYNPLGWVERSLGAIAKGPDFAAYTAVYKQEMRKQGFLDAKSKGIKGKQNIDNHVEKFINDPPETAALQADRIGKNTTFQRSDTLGGQAATALNSGTGKVRKYVAPIAHTIFPFVRTPVNIASTAVTLTPGGIIKGLYQLTAALPEIKGGDKSKIVKGLNTTINKLKSDTDASRREAIRNLSLGITGTLGLSPLGYYLSGIGVITGANDSGDKDVDNIREQAGKGKYRFNTSALQRYMTVIFDGKGAADAEKAAEYQEGDEAFDYNKMQPIAFPVAIGASFQETKGKPMLERVSKAFEDSYGSLYGMSTLKGVQDIFQPQYGGTIGEKALGTPKRIAEAYVKSFSPSMLAQEARRQDPIVRKTPYNEEFEKDVGDYFKSRTPGLSQSLPSRKTTLGQDKMNAPGVTGQYLNPLKSEVAPYNEAAKIITDLIERTGNEKLAPKAPEKTVSGTRNGVTKKAELTPERYAQLQEEVGKEIMSKITDAEFKRREKEHGKPYTDDQKMVIIEKIYADARERAAKKVKRELGIPIN